MVITIGRVLLLGRPWAAALGSLGKLGQFSEITCQNLLRCTLESTLDHRKQAIIAVRGMTASQEVLSHLHYLAIHES